MKRTVLFITGTDTGVGKTVLATHLVRRLVERSVATRAFKPLASGGRSDAESLHAALGGGLPLAVVSPWYFRAPIAPVLAARRKGRRVVLAEVVGHIRQHAHGATVVVVEGAGGLLSPLGADFDNRDLLVALRACPLIVAPNRLGAVNQVRLVLAALPSGTRKRAVVVLVGHPRPAAIERSNAELLGEGFDAWRIHRWPWLARQGATAPRKLRRRLDDLLRAAGVPG